MTTSVLDIARRDAPGSMTRDQALRFMAELLLVLVDEAMPKHSSPTREAEARLVRIIHGDFDEGGER